jgi:DNA-binding response OmpR family regulator
MTILLVDDDPDIRALVRLKLEQMGHAVIVESDGARALDSVAQHVPSLVLLDVMMPNLDGIAACRKLRGADATSGTPIILMTAKARDVDIEQGLAAGATDYIVKPFSLRDLADRVESALGA